MYRKSITLTLFSAVILFWGLNETKALSAFKPLNIAGQLEGEIVISTTVKLGRINADIYGQFMPMVLREFDGGIWAEMLKSRKFAQHDGEDEKYGVVKPWLAIGRNKKTHFAHDNTIYYSGVQSQKIISEDAANRRIGIGQDGLYFDKTKSYLARVNLRQKDIKGPIIIALEGQNNIYAKKEINISGTDWRRFSLTLKPNQTDKNGKFTITFSGSGTLWLGTVSLMPDDNISGFRKDILEALKAIRPPNIRWPGGCNAEDYNWQDGIGDRDKRPARFNRGYPAGGEMVSNDVGIDEFMELCRLTNTKPYVNVNIGLGNAEEAANWVQYCNGGANTKYGKLRIRNGHPQPYNIKLWGIGNEMYGNWQIGHLDEETYALKYLKFAKAMRAVDKDIKLVAVGARYWKFPRWNQALFKIAGEWFDYLALHSYAKKYRSTAKKEDLKDPKFAKETYYYIVSSPYGVEEQIIETIKEVREALPHRQNIAIAFDEWNAMLYRIPSREMNPALRDGIYTAGIFHAFRRQFDKVTLADFASTINLIPLIWTNPSNMVLNPQYLAFKMYVEHCGPVLIKSEVKCDSFPAPEYEKGRPQAISHIPYLDVSATKSSDGKKVYVAVLNLHADKNVKTQIAFDKWDFSSQVKIFELYDGDFLAENTFENPNAVAIKENTLNNISNSFSYNFKPHSVTVMQFSKK